MSEDRLVIDVIDNGGGVDAEEASLVFEKFSRGRHATTQQGAGLGLPISRAILRSMGGDLRVEFENSETSFFRIELPLLAEHAQTVHGPVET